MTYDHEYGERVQAAKSRDLRSKSDLSAGLSADLWQVEISLGGESILVIGHNHLSGRDDVGDYTEAIELCADHLLSFIGKGR